MLNQKYKGYTFYAHNFSGFDVNFILNALSQLQNEGYKIIFMKNNDKYINISISNFKKGVQINIRDSLLILPMGLSKLGSQFGVEVLKAVEPVYLNENDVTNPFLMKDLSHYSKDVLLITDFQVWKDKVTNYCETDCVSLYQIIIKFRDLVYDIYKGKVFNFIRESFTGGATEMYKPYGENINCYDVNSLYPTSMSQNKFPVGQTYEFIGDIDLFYQLENPKIWNIPIIFDVIKKFVK